MSPSRKTRAATPLDTVTVMRITAASLLAAAGLTDCSTQQYRYVPVDRSTGPNDQERTEVMYAEPPEKPQGHVRILSYGIVTMRPKEGSGNTKEFPALHLRMILSNQSSDQVWLLDGENQTVSFPNQGPNQGQTRPVYVNSDVNSIPSLQVNPRELRVWDLFYPLPESEKGANDLLTFDFHWSFKAGSFPVSETTSFTRVPVADEPVVVYPYVPPYGPYPFYGWGWGGYWWRR